MKLAAELRSLLPGMAGAAMVLVAGLSPAAADKIENPVAVFSGLDKITGRTQDFTLAVGESVAFGRLQLSLAECRYPAADPTSDAYAELTITDHQANARLFAGWMIASSPALSALDDPRYDVWVISCNRA